MRNNKLNGFNNGIDASDGVGGNPPDRFVAFKDNTKTVDKSNILCYVLVANDAIDLHYYEGYCIYSEYLKMIIPQCSRNFTDAVKIIFKDEAEALCKIVNGHYEIQFHVEEHMYMGK